MFQKDKKLRSLKANTLLLLSKKLILKNFEVHLSLHKNLAVEDTQRLYCFDRVHFLDSKFGYHIARLTKKIEAIWIDYKCIRVETSEIIQFELQ